MNPPLSERHQRARELGALDVLERLHHAKEQLAQVAQNKSQSRDKNRRLKTAKVSLTDPESRVMRLANGAIAPAKAPKSQMPLTKSPTARRRKSIQPCE